MWGLVDTGINVIVNQTNGWIECEDCIMDQTSGDNIMRECAGISVIWKDGRMQCGGCIVKSNNGSRKGAEQRSTVSSTEVNMENREGTNQGDMKPDQGKREYQEWLERTRQEARLRWSRETRGRAHWINQQRQDAWLNKEEELVEQEEKPIGYSQEGLQSQPQVSSETDYKETGGAKDERKARRRDTRPYIIPQRRKNGEVRGIGAKSQAQEEPETEVAHLPEPSQDQIKQQARENGPPCLGCWVSESQGSPREDHGTPGPPQDRIYLPPVLRSTSSQRKELIASLEQFMHNSEVNHARDLEEYRDPWDEAWDLGMGLRHQDLEGQGPPAQDQGSTKERLVWVNQREGSAASPGGTTTGRSNSRSNSNMSMGQSEYARLANALDGGTTTGRDSRSSSKGYDKQTSGMGENIKEGDVQPISVGQLDYARLANALDVTAIGSGLLQGSLGSPIGEEIGTPWVQVWGPREGAPYGKVSTKGMAARERELLEAIRRLEKGNRYVYCQSSVRLLGKGNCQSSPELEAPEGSSASRFSWATALYLAGPSPCTRCQELKQLNQQLYDRYLQLRKGLEEGSDYLGPTEELTEQEQVCREYVISEGPECRGCLNLKGLFRQLFYLYLTVVSSYFGAYVTRVVPILEHQKRKLIQKLEQIQGNRWPQGNEEGKSRVSKDGNGSTGWDPLEGGIGNMESVAQGPLAADLTQVEQLRHQRQILIQKLEQIQGGQGLQEEEEEKRRISENEKGLIGWNPLSGGRGSTESLAQGPLVTDLTQMFFCSCTCRACRICECGELCFCAGEDLVRRHQGEVGRFLGCSCQQACEACGECHCRDRCQCSSKGMKNDKGETPNRQAKQPTQYFQKSTEEEWEDQRVTDKEGPWQPSVGRGLSEYMELRGEPPWWGSMLQPLYMQSGEIGKQDKGEQEEDNEREPRVPSPKSQVPSPNPNRQRGGGQEVRWAQNQRMIVNQAVIFDQAEEKGLRLNNLAKEQLKDYEEDMTGMEGQDLFDESTRGMMEQLFFKDEKMREMSLESIGSIVAIKLASEGYYQTKARGGGGIKCFCCQDALQIELGNITAPKDAPHRRHNQRQRQQNGACRFWKGQSHLDSTPYQWVLGLIAIRNRKWTINRYSFLHMSQQEDNRRANREIHEQSQWRNDEQQAYRKNTGKWTLDSGKDQWAMTAGSGNWQ